MLKKIFSGLQPSGSIHLGNYLGAIKQWVSLQDQADEAIYCVVDLHAITVPQNPNSLNKNILDATAWYLALGINPDKSKIFVQSDRPEHTELMWVLNTLTKMGELSRMTQFKDKTAKMEGDSICVGLFDYPVLMAADILLYKATHVPVGEDQKQHVEITRDLAARFNRVFGETFPIPEPIIKKEAARIMGLDNPLKKMSKSAESEYNYIALSDSPEIITKKIMKAVTDSGTEIKSGPDKPALTNLLTIYSEFSGKPIGIIEGQFNGKGYGEFKKSLAELIVESLRPIQEKHLKLMNDPAAIRDILKKGSEQLANAAKQTIADVKKKVGLGLNE